jgi:hypothetical protein
MHRKKTARDSDPLDRAKRIARIEISCLLSSQPTKAVTRAVHFLILLLIGDTPWKLELHGAGLGVSLVVAVLQHC